MSTVIIAEHPLLDARVFRSSFSRPLGEMSTATETPLPGATATPAAIAALLAADVETPLSSSDEVRKTVRDLLRHGGFKPTGRSKPSAEYLRKAQEKGRLGPINLAVDIANAVSLHSGLPISVVDHDKVTAPLRLAIAEVGASFVFNRSGQIIDVGKLLCLHDADGPCANAVKDAQRSKTDEATRATISVIWGTKGLPGHTDAAFAWYQQLLADFGVPTELLPVETSA